MSEEFKYVYSESDRISWLFVEAIGGLGLDSPFFRNIEPGAPFTVEMKVNGFDVPFARTMALLDARYQKCVESAAKELVEERAADLMSRLTDLRDHVTNKIRELFPDLE